MRITKAVIPAAGLGTRVLPATKNMPKEMYPIVDKPTIQFIVEGCCGRNYRYSHHHKPWQRTYGGSF